MDAGRGSEALTDAPASPLSPGRAPRRTGRWPGSSLRLSEIEPGGAVDTYTADPEIETDLINLDFDRERRLIGIEVLSASRHLPPELISQATPPGRQRHDCPRAATRVL
jgi:uncharacterized protein YuzE